MLCGRRREPQKESVLPLAVLVEEICRASVLHIWSALSAFGSS